MGWAPGGGWWCILIFVLGVPEQGTIVQRKETIYVCLFSWRSAAYLFRAPGITGKNGDFVG